MTMPTSAELQRYVGQRAMLDHFGLDVEVVIADVKTAYGNVRFLVEPVAGGEKRLWVDIRRLDFEIDPFG